MSATVPHVVRKCQRCWCELAPAALVCDQCHALVHADELERMATEAKALEASGELRHARDRWLAGLSLLPAASKQAEWIRNHAYELARAAYSAPAPQAENRWAGKLAPLGPIALLLAKGKTLLALFKLNFLFSLVAFMGVYWKIYGAQFGVGLGVLVLIHEMGHFIDIKRRGLPAEMPVFLPGLGAYVRWQALGVPAETRAAVSLAGPLAGWLAAAVCALLWWTTGNALWAALARASAWLNVLNLIPVWALDGGQAAVVLSRAERVAVLTAGLALWLVLGENVFFLVAAGAVYRLFTRDTPSHPSRATTAYFVATLVLLGLVMRLMPGVGFGVQ